MTPTEHADNADYADLVPLIERAMGASLGGRVRLAGVERISEPDRRNQLLRWVVAGGPPGTPATVIVKRRRPADYDPENPTSFATRGLFSDWAGLQFLTESGPELVGSPRFYGGDRAAGLVVMEDLGTPKGLHDLLLAGSAAEAERGLVLLATTLGRLHAATAGREAEYLRIRDALGPGAGAAQRAEDAEQVRKEGKRALEHCASLGVTVAAGFEHDVEAIAAATADPGPFLAYTHGDPCPDNCAVSLGGRGGRDDTFRLLDFEIGGYRHALRDGVYGRIRFPTCWCVRDLPEAIVERMEGAYRAELVRGCPAAADDAAYLCAVAETCGAWVLTTVAWSLPQLLEYDTQWGVATRRQRILLRLPVFAEVARRAAHLQALAETGERLAAALRARWEPSTMPIAAYPAFTRDADPAPARVAALARAIDEGDLAAAGRLLDEAPALTGTEAGDADGRRLPMLMRAIRRQRPAVVGLLLERGADWRLAPGSGDRNLVVAAEQGAPELVRLLLDHGALPDARDGHGFRPLHVAARDGHGEVVELLLARGAEVDALAAMYLDRFDEARRLLEAQPAQARFRFGNGSSMLHRVALRGVAAARYVPLLVARGAPLEARAWPGRTALHVAAEEGHAEVVRALLAAGADPAAEDQNGETPRSLAQAGGHTDVAALLGGPEPTSATPDAVGAP